MDIFKAVSRQLLCSRKRLEEMFVEVSENGTSYLVERRFFEKAMSKYPNPEPERTIITPAEFARGL